MTADARTVAGAVGGAGAVLAGGAVAVRLRRHEGRSGPSRKYVIKGGEDAVDGVRRAAIGRLDDALDQLDGNGESDKSAAIHETRKDMKKVRSILRLVRDWIGDDVYRRENDRYRQIAQLLGGSRDSHVKVETLGALAERYPDDVPSGRWTDLTRALEAEASADLDPARLERARDQILAGRSAVASWPLGSEGWGLVAGGLTRGYRRGRARFADVRDEAHDDAVHEWRKRVKDHWYHLRLLERSWKPVLAETADQIHDLADALGDHHDLAVLRADACSRPQLLGEAELNALLDLIARRQNELLTDAIAVGERVYAEKPKHFSRRLARYWSAWR